MSCGDSYGASVHVHANVKELKGPFVMDSFILTPPAALPFSFSSYVTNRLSFPSNICVCVLKDEKSYFD